MKNTVIFSFVMAAYQSQKTIGRALASIRAQNFDQERIEIYVVDGGSEDRTREIAREYGARVIDNPHRLPEPAKMLGLQAVLREGGASIFASWIRTKNSWIPIFYGADTRR